MMNMMPKSLLPLLLVSLAVAGQSSPAPAQSRLQELDFMLGEWKGAGCMFRVDHSCMKVSQTIKVQRNSSGNGIRIEETLKLKARSDFAETIGPATHGTLLTFDETSQLWVASVGKKQFLRGKLIDPKTFQWEAKTEIGIARTTIKLSDQNEWHYTVESWSGNPKGWVQMIDCRLKPSK